MNKTVTCISLFTQKTQKHQEALYFHVNHENPKTKDNQKT